MGMQTTNDRRSETGKRLNEEVVFNLVRTALQELQFGTVTIVVQNGRVVQIERHEKTRLTQID
jgi:hypothetical protein